MNRNTYKQGKVAPILDKHPEGWEDWSVQERLNWLKSSLRTKPTTGFGAIVDTVNNYAKACTAQPRNDFEQFFLGGNLPACELLDL